MNYQVEPIGYIESCYKDKFGTPRQGSLVKSSWAEVKVLKKAQPLLSLMGLETFSHVWVVFWFHLNTNKKFHPKVHPPKAGGKSWGVFATRSPHRPNPIGLSLAKLERVKGDRVLISGIDLVEGTPVLDLKPYLVYADRVQGAVSGWIEKPHKLKVQWSLEALKKNKKFNLSKSEKKLIVDTLKLDPRPLVYTKNDYQKTHNMRISKYDIQFQVLKNELVLINDLSEI